MARYELTESTKSLTATRFIRFTKALWLSINLGKQITSENIGGSKKNTASDLPCGLHSKTADIHSSIILAPVCPHSFDVLSKSYLYKIPKQRFGASHRRESGFFSTPLPKSLLGLPPVSHKASLSNTVTLLRQHPQGLSHSFPFSLQLTLPRNNEKWGR